MKNKLKFVWLILCLIGFIFPTYLMYQKNILDYGIVGTVSLLILTFPSGFLGFGLSSLILKIESIDLLAKNHKIIADIIISSIIIFFGYAQWFMLVPKFTAKFKANKNP